MKNFQIITILFFLVLIKSVNSGPLEIQLLNAAKKGDLKSIIENIQCIKSFSIDINESDDDGKSALIYACEHGLDEAIELLIEAGANINFVDKRNKNALHWAVMNEHINAVAILINYEINLNAKDVNKVTPLMLAVAKKNSDIVELLLKNNAKVDIKDNLGNSALFTAVSLNQEEIVDQLISYKSNVNVKNNLGNTPLMISISNCNVNITEALLLAGANPMSTNLFFDSPAKTVLKKSNDELKAIIYDNIAEKFFYGYDSEIDFKYSFDMYNYVLSLNIPFYNSKANFHLGLMYYFGIEEDRDWKLALKYFKKVDIQSMNENMLALYNSYLGMIYYNGPKSVRNLSLSYYHFTNSLAGSLTPCDVAVINTVLGLIYSKTGDINRAIEYLQKGASQDDNLLYNAIANESLGSIYKKNKNYSLAIKHFNKATINNFEINSKANFKLGTMFYFGKGVPIDYNFALECFNKVKKNDLDQKSLFIMHFYIGRIYFELKDYDKAVSNLHIAYNQEVNGHASALAKKYLALYYYKIGDTEKVSMYTNELINDTKVNRKNQILGAYLLGKFNLEIKKYEDAKSIFASLIKQNVLKKIKAKSHFQLGKIYLKGLCGEIDYDLTIKHLKEALNIEEFPDSHETEAFSIIDSIKKIDETFLESKH